MSCNDIKIGSVIKKFSLSPNFGIYNSNNKEVLKLKGSFLGMSLEHKLKVLIIYNYFKIIYFIPICLFI